MENRIDIPLTTTDFTSISKNGTLSHLINLRHEGNVLRPIGKKREAHPLTMAGTVTKIFLHKTAEWESWIKFAAGVLSNFGGKDKASKTTVTAFDSTICADGGTLLEIRSFKNYLYAITTTQMRVYFGYTGDNDYVLYKRANVYDFRKIDFRIGTRATNTLFEGVNHDYYLFHTSSYAENFDIAILDDIYKLESKMSAEQGGLPGVCWFRVGLRLFDDTVLFPTQPIFSWGAKVDFGLYKAHRTGESNSTVIHYTPRIYSNLYTLSVLSSVIDSLLANNTVSGDVCNVKNFVKGIEIFASAPQRVFDLDKGKLQKNETLRLATVDTVYPYSNLFALNELFRDKGNDPEIWYKVGTHNLEDIVNMLGSGGYYNMDIDLKNYWTDYATRETFALADESWHVAVPKASKVYNSRLLLGDIKISLSDGYLFQQPTDAVFDWFVKGSVSGDIVYRSPAPDTLSGYSYAYLKTSDGERIVRTALTYRAYKKYTYNGSTYSLTGGNDRLIALPGQIGYPDRRAYKMVFTIIQPSNNAEMFLKEVVLTSSVNSNFSQYVNVSWGQARENGFASNAAFSASMFSTYKYFNFTTLIIQYSGTTLPGLSGFTAPTYLSSYIDQNRIIVSEVDNPFTFLAKHSYRVGSGRIVAMDSTTETLSLGQFGQYPVNVFTNEGIYALMQGDNGVLFSSIVPMNSEVCIGRNTLPIHGSIIFISERGIAALSGKEVSILSLPLNTIVSNSLTPNPIRGMDIYGQITAHAQLFGMANFEYVLEDIRSLITANTSLAFDRARNEIIISDPAWTKHIYYSMESKCFSFADEQFISTCDTYSEHFALTSGGKIVFICSNSGDLGQNQSEESTNPVKVLLQTKPIKFGRELAINDIEILMGLIASTGKYTGIAVFGNEAKKVDKWFLLGGTQASAAMNLYKTNTLSRMKVQEIIVLITSICDYDSWIAPMISLNTKQKFNQVKS